MDLTRRGRVIFKKSVLNHIKAVVRAIKPPMMGQPVRVWLVRMVAITAIIGGLAVASALLAPTVSAGPDLDTPQDCLKCHTRVLKSHDKLGSGTEACLVCHDSTHMGMLRLFNGTTVPLEEDPELCRQCHTSQYSDWAETRHGVANRKQVQPGTELPSCVQCHDPHQPHMVPTDGDIPLVSPIIEADELDCLNCHVRILKAHDVLGSGSKACWACHYNKEMGVLHLADGAKVSLQAYMDLCAQCHQERYQAWEEGTHGVPKWNGDSAIIDGINRQQCLGCHNPHKPQIVFTGITRPHPEPAPSPTLPGEPLIVLGISLTVIVTAVIILTQRGKEA